LQYQVDNRLQGAAGAGGDAACGNLSDEPQAGQGASGAARDPYRLSNEIRVPWLMIEARALSDIGRHDSALEVIAGLEGRESLRLRSDIYWASRNWQKAAEHIELLYGDRWEELRAAHRRGARRHAARRRCLFAGRGQARRRAAPR
jgi:hypothetical protein